MAGEGTGLKNKATSMTETSEQTPDNATYRIPHGEMAESLTQFAVKSWLTEKYRLTADAN